MFYIFLLATAVSAGKIYEWKLPTELFGEVTTQMTTLDKTLADDPQAYIKCFQELWNRKPNEPEYKYNKDVYGRKKRDLSKNMEPYPQEIPFLISANYSLCVQRRLALAIRKFEERTCINFVPYEREGRHQAAVLMIHNIQNTYSEECNANFGQQGIDDSILDGKQIPHVGSASITEGCELSFEHEIMHVLGFIHAQDRTVKIGPWERNSAASYIQTENPDYLTDWDTWKINKVYNCKTTTYGKKPIDMNNTPPPVKNDFSIRK